MHVLEYNKFPTVFAIHFGFCFQIPGLTNFCDDVEFMTKQKVSFYWRICWAVITPLLLLFIFVYSLAELKTLKYAGMDYPQSANSK